MVDDDIINNTHDAKQPGNTKRSQTQHPWRLGRSEAVCDVTPRSLNLAAQNSLKRLSDSRFQLPQPGRPNPLRKELDSPLTTQALLGFRPGRYCYYAAVATTLRTLGLLTLLNVESSATGMMQRMGRRVIQLTPMYLIKFIRASSLVSTRPHMRVPTLPHLQNCEPVLGRSGTAIWMISLMSKSSWSRHRRSYATEQLLYWTNLRSCSYLGYARRRPQLGNRPHL